MTVYLVISHNLEKQQTFWDTVPAESEGAATGCIGRLRPHAVVVDVLDRNLVRSVASDMLSCSIAEVQERLAELPSDSVAD